jgi:hypothetical protein
MSSGRPVLFIPYTGSFPDVGERSIVALGRELLNRTPFPSQCNLRFVRRSAIG